MNEKNIGITGLIIASIIVYIVISWIIARKAHERGFGRPRLRVDVGTTLHDSMTGLALLVMFMTVFFPSWIILGIYKIADWNYWRKHPGSGAFY